MKYGRVEKIRRPIMPDLAVGISRGGAVDVTTAPREAMCTRMTVDIRDAELASAAGRVMPEVLREAIKYIVQANADRIREMVFEEITNQREAARKAIWAEIAATIRREFTDE